MSPTHQTPGSPISPLSPLPSCHPESFAPLNQSRAPAAITRAQKPQHQYLTQPKEPIVSPLTAEWPDSPTLGHLSPVSIISPDLPAPIRSDRPPAAESRSPAAPEPSLARGGTLHLQDHVPFQPSSTRFPPRKPLANNPLSRTPATDAEDDAASARPVTIYLADHSPHRAAPAPTTPIQRPHYATRLGFHQGRSGEAVGGAGFEDVEMREVGTRGGSSGSEGGFWARGSGVRDAEGGGELKVKTKLERKARKRNCLIGWTFLLVLVVVIVVLALSVVHANRLDSK